ncbi:MAG: hypothetical protein PHF83_03335 [Candidatus Methanomethylophilus sp.]|nr:hypothetical protein [Methanomethylophilus sp.]
MAMTFAIVLAFVVTAVPLSDLGSSESAADDSSFTITDGNNCTFEFDGAVSKLVVFGYAACVTIAETGNIDKIIGADTYSQYNYYSDSRLETLNAYNLGSPYAKDFTAVETWLLQQVQDGNFDKEKDAVIITSSSSANANLIPALKEDGFVNVLFWGKLADYSGMINCVDSISQIAAGKTNNVKTQVDTIYGDVKSDVNSRNGETVPYIYLWYDSTNGIEIGTDACLGSSMLNAAGGDNIASDAQDTSGGFWYGGTSGLIQYLDTNPNAIIFIADNFNMTGEQFCTEYLGGDTSHYVYVMEKNWNNYCLDSVKGLQTATEFFGTYVDSGNDNGNSNSNVTMYAVIVAIIIVVAVVGIGYYMYNKKKKDM